MLESEIQCLVPDEVAFVAPPVLASTPLRRMRVRRRSDYYYDTKDRELYQAGMQLRLRLREDRRSTSWQLKVPHLEDQQKPGMRQRDEIEGGYWLMKPPKEVNPSELGAGLDMYLPDERLYLQGCISTRSLDIDFAQPVSPGAASAAPAFIVSWDEIDYDGLESERRLEIELKVSSSKTAASEIKKDSRKEKEEEFLSAVLLEIQKYIPNNSELIPAEAGKYARLVQLLEDQ